MKSITNIAALAALLLTGQQVEAKYLPTDMWHPKPEDMAPIPKPPPHPKPPFVRRMPADYVPGTCHVHLKEKWNDGHVISVLLHIMDANGTVIAEAGSDFASAWKPFNVTGDNMPGQMTIEASGAEDTSPIVITYNDQLWDTNNKDRCKTGKYDTNWFTHKVMDEIKTRQMDCTFEC